MLFMILNINEGSPASAKGQLGPGFRLPVLCCAVFLYPVFDDPEGGATTIIKEKAG